MELKRAILFLNLGGPEKQKDVRPFLYRLFSDPEIIRIKFTPLRKFVAWAISTMREKESRLMYEKIGGGSPIRRLTDEQANATRAALSASGLQADVRTAFTCSDPLVEDVVKDLSRNGVKKILAFPLYPQFSLTTTKGALDRTSVAVKKWAPQASLFEVRSWATHPKFIQAHADLIRSIAHSFSDPSHKNIHLVFSAHSIPENLVTKMGDPYRDQVEQTVKSILEKANWNGPWTLGWQSKLGPVKWLGPSTEKVILELGQQGAKQVLVAPIAFVTDHIETLYELDQELAEEAREAGIKEFRRVPGLNNYPVFIEALADIAIRQKEFWMN